MANSSCDIHEEVSLCSRIYPGFEEIGGSLRSVFDSADTFMAETDAAEPMGIVLNQEEADERFRRGESLRLRPEVARDRFWEATATVCDGVIAMYPEVADLKEAVGQFRQDFVDEAFPGSHETFDFADGAVTDLLTILPQGEALGRDLSTFIASLTLSCLYRWCLRDSHRLDTGLWGEGHCPVCGHRPHFGLLRDDDGARVLECWLCSTRWMYPRLKCPFCQNVDHEELGYFVVESMDACRLHFCSKCNRYLKMFDLRQHQGDGSILAIHNLATLSCDLVAAREGFDPGSELQWIDAEKL